MHLSSLPSYSNRVEAYDEGGDPVGILAQASTFEQNETYGVADRRRIEKRTRAAIFAMIDVTERNRGQVQGLTSLIMGYRRHVYQRCGTGVRLIKDRT